MPSRPSYYTKIKFLIESATDAITAFAGGGQSGAFQIINSIARVTTVATAGDSVMLPTAKAGADVLIINHGANPMQVFGNGSDTIDDVAAATGVSQMPGSLCLYTCSADGSWYSNGLGTGYSGSLPTQSYTDAITAHAGGGQASAVTLTTVLNRVTTVASGNDSVALPTAAPGLQIIVINAAAANSLNVFPVNGGADAINALAANSAFAVAANKVCSFYCTAPGHWHSLLTA